MSTFISCFRLARPRLQLKRCYGLVNKNWERKRFYQKVDVYSKKQDDEVLYGVSLDHRQLKTPLRNLFLVPSERLAVAVTQEWDEQEQYIQTHGMHLTHLCNTVIDKPVVKSPSEHIQSVLPFLDTDLLRCVGGDNPEVAHLHSQEWGAQVEWFNTSYFWHHGDVIQHVDIKSPLAYSRFGTSVTQSPDLVPKPVSSSDRTKVIKFLETFNEFSLMSFVFCVESAKSLMLSAALFEQQISVQQAAELSLLEMLYQARRWGQVEWSHDVDLKDLLSRLSAANLVHLLS